MHTLVTTLDFNNRLSFSFLTLTNYIKMKRISLLAFCLLLAILSFSQTDSVQVWNKWCSKKDTLLLFNAGNNVIQFYSLTLKPTEYTVKCVDWASIKIGNLDIKGDTLSVMAMPYPTKGKFMRIAITNKKTNKVIKTVYFNSDNIPPLTATIGKIHGTEATKADILASVSLKTLFQNSLYSYPYAIKSYTFKTQNTKGNANINVNGFFLTKDVLQQISDAPVGSIIEFTNIKATCPECEPRTLPDIKLKIK